MCQIAKGKLHCVMDGQQKYQGLFLECSNLLELAAADDVTGFKYMVEEKGVNLDETSFWYGRRNCTERKMGFEERTPLMIASVYGSSQVLKYIIDTKKVDVNKASDSDGATALHCAAAGGSAMSVEAVRLLLEASANVYVNDHRGNKPGNLIPRGVKASMRRELEVLLNGFSSDEEMVEDKEMVSVKKEYPVDVSMPDINNGVYGSDEFRMYTFKVKPCSRAYTHDWTECPFVHPGENARRRDLKKFNYSCVPCPEFRKGSCVKGDSCEYAHGVFESWLHPAQYRTRLCKDEIGCARKVCFFAHRVEELRPVYASTGSGLPSPKSGVPVASMEMGSMSPLALGATTPMSPPTSPMWQNKVNHLTPPALQLPGSRLKTSLNARDFEMEAEFFGSESLRNQQQQRRQIMEDLSNNLYNINNRFVDLKPTNLDDVYGSLDQSLLSQFHGLLSPKVSNTTTQMLSQSPTSRQQFDRNSNPIRASYPSPNYTSSPVRKPGNYGYGFDSSAAVAQAVMNSRAGSFTKQRSQSFIDRGAGMSPRSIPQQNSSFTEWGSPDGKLDWGFSGEDANKLRKSASFGLGGGAAVGVGLHSSRDAHRYSGNSEEKLPQWIEQMYIEQEQMVA
uniref:zinc finger CCCH domain-containing protein 29-like n=1 Tax=Erigeron canadensis TaxID=72917 RepID=UPI001CB94A41|nr:zinc finger CCCH domain-containing protein 29-like [Erigeron canadensis]